MDYIKYNEDLKDIWIGNLYRDKQGRGYGVERVSPTSVTLVYDDGYVDDDSPFNCISISIKMNAFKKMIENNELQWVGRDLLEPWIRESDILVINGEEFYVDDVIPISASLLIMDETTDWKYVDYHELDVIVNNCSQFLKERLLLERS